MGVLGIMGAKPQPDDRIVRSGKIVTAAGVSSGIDLALWLASQIVGRERGEVIQLTIEYDRHASFDAGHMLAKEIVDTRMPSDPAACGAQDCLEAPRRSDPHRKIAHSHQRLFCPCVQRPFKLLREPT
jgi:transcriptional regulator GlxA family with amidase domain